MVRHADRVCQAGFWHMSRGLLLHGPPGTGKTLSAMYLASQMPGRTVLILTGGGMNSIEASGQLARALAAGNSDPLEDVDLLIKARGASTRRWGPTPCCSSCSTRWTVGRAGGCRRAVSSADDKPARTCMERGIGFASRAD